MLSYDFDAMTSKFTPQYDWCFSSYAEKRTPDEYRYGFDAYFLWRNFSKSKMDGISSVYSDRMLEWDRDKYDKAKKCIKGHWVDNLNEDAANKFIESYYDGKYECVGFGRACNVSTGYPLGVFFLKEKKATTKTKSAS